MDELGRNQSKRMNRKRRVKRARNHMKGSKKNWVTIAIDGEKVFVQKKNTNIGRIPRSDDNNRNKRRRRSDGKIVGIIITRFRRRCLGDFKKDLVRGIVEFRVAVTTGSPLFDHHWRGI